MATLQDGLKIMINNDLRNICINSNTPIKKVLFKIQKFGKNGVFVVDKKFHLKGMITDSDIRKKNTRKKI